MTLIGAVPNVIISGRFSEYISFTDFMVNMAPAIIIMTPFVIMFLRWKFREFLSSTYRVEMSLLFERHKIKEPQLLLRGGTVSCFVIITLFLHPVHQRPTGWLALIGAMATIPVGTSKTVAKVLQDVEWDTLLFIAGLYVLGAALIELGFIRRLGSMIIGIVKSTEPHSQLAVACVIILWISSLVSGFLSNIGFAATMTRVISIVGEDP